MQLRQLGKTGIDISEIALGAGPVSELMVGLDHPQQLATVSQASEIGINWVDTAATYGNGHPKKHWDAPALQYTILKSMLRQRSDYQRMNWTILLELSVAHCTTACLALIAPELRFCNSTIPLLAIEETCLPPSPQTTCSGQVVLQTFLNNFDRKAWLIISG